LRLGGKGLLNHYNGSPSLLISTAYPDYEWLPWKFTVAPMGYWENPENHRKFLHWAGKLLGVKDMSGWYKVTQEVISI
jgi:hypothetical protein